MFTTSLKAFGCAAVLALIPPCAQAQSLCTKSEDIAAMLESRYGEKQVSLAFTSQDKAVARFESENGATWTLVHYTDDTYACIVMTGQNWYERPSVEGGAT